MPNTQEKPLIDFGPFKGIDNFTAGYYLDPQRATDLVGIVPETHIGSYWTVLGRVANVNVGANAILGLTRFDRTGLASEYLACSNTGGGAAGLWAFPTGGPVTQLTYPANVTPTASQPSYFAPSDKWEFLANGADPLVKIDASLNVTLAQLAAPATPPTVAAGGAGNLNSAGNPYLWRVTFSNSSSGVESGGGAISTALTLASQSANLTAIPTSADPQCNQRNIYRIGGIWSIWLLVGSINDNVTTIFTDNVADTALGIPMTVVRDQPPTAPWYLAAHKDRLYIFGSPTDPVGLWYSNYKEPFGWNLLSQYFSIGKAGMGDIAAGPPASLGSTLVLFKTKSTWVVFGDDPTSFIPRKILDIGCVAPRSITVALGVVFWLATDGVWMYDGSKPTRISTNIEGTILALAQSDLQRAVGFYRNGIFYLSFPSTGVTYAYNLGNQEWYKVGWAAEVCFFDPNLLEVTASRAGVGNIDSWFAATTDLGSAISAAFTGKIDDSGQPQGEKCYRDLLLVAPLQTGQTATVTIIYDPGVNQTSFSAVMDLSAYPIRKMISVPPPQKAYQAQLSITTTSTVQLEIQKVQAVGWVEREYTVRV